MALYNRAVSVLIGNNQTQEALNVSGLQVVFNVHKYAAGEDVNTCDLTIYNLSKTTRNILENIDGILVLRAGYSQDVGPKQIFKGAITEMYHKPTPPDVMTVIQAKDGIKSITKKGLSKSYKAGTSGKKILRDLINFFAIPLSNLSSLTETPDKIFSRGISLDDPITKSLSEVTSHLGLTWSIQNEELKIIKNYGVDKQVISLTSDTGLIGSPERILDTKRDETIDSNKRKKAGWRFISLLQPTIEPGNYISVESAEITPARGFRVSTVTHEGDFFGQAWTTTIEAYDHAK